MFVFRSKFDSLARAYQELQDELHDYTKAKIYLRSELFAAKTREESATKRVTELESELSLRNRSMAGAHTHIKYLHELEDAKDREILALRGQVADLTTKLAKAERNDHRDPKTGRFIKGHESDATAYSSAPYMTRKSFEDRQRPTCAPLGDFLTRK